MVNSSNVNSCAGFPDFSLNEEDRMDVREVQREFVEQLEKKFGQNNDLSFEEKTLEEKTFKLSMDITTRQFNNKDITTDHQSRREIEHYNREILDQQFNQFIMTSTNSVDERKRQGFVKQFKKKEETKLHLISKLQLQAIQKSYKELEEDLMLGIKNISKDVEGKDSSLESRTQDADRMMEQLIQEEQKSKKVRRGNNNKPNKSATNKKKQTVKKKQSLSQKQISAVKKKQTVSTHVPQKDFSSSEDKRSKFALDLLKKSCLEHPRIKRWKKNDPASIRKFEDTDQSGKVYRYRDLNDEQIFEQRIRHYLPGTEQILSHDAYRDIYAFPTDRGYGLVAQLAYNQERHNGVLYFGVDKKSHYVFHKYFKDVIFKKSENSLFIDQETCDVEESEEQEWMTEKDFRLDISEEGVLKFSYTDHNIRILPIRTDLFQRKISSIK
jgi:hypothetical protein